MSLPGFEYIAPITITDAVNLAQDDSMFVAGGTDLFIRMKERICTPKRVIGLQNIPEIHLVTTSPTGDLKIGALVTLSELADTIANYPELTGFYNAILQTSSPLLRNAGTIGGNLCQQLRCCYYNQPPIFRQRWPNCFKMGGDRCHVVKGGKECYAVYSGDLAGPLIAMGASMCIEGRHSRREIKIEDLFTGSGDRPFTLSSDEIITEITLPKISGSWGLSYQKLRLRDTIDYPLLGITVFLKRDPSKPKNHYRNTCMVLGAAGPSPLIVKEASAMIDSAGISKTVIEKIGDMVQKMVKPVANTTSTPKYRREMLPVLTKRAFHEALAQMTVYSV